MLQKHSGTLKQTRGMVLINKRNYASSDTDRLRCWKCWKGRILYNNVKILHSLETVYRSC